MTMEKIVRLEQAGVALCLGRRDLADQLVSPSLRGGGEMNERKKGFYVVKFGDRWQVAEWDPDETGELEGWWMIGRDLPVSEDRLAEIGPRIRMPDEPVEIVKELPWAAENERLLRERQSMERAIRELTGIESVANEIIQRAIRAAEVSE